MSITEEKTKRPRKPKARHRDVIFAAIEERMECLVRDDTNEVHLNRLDDLFDELKRSVNGKAESEESE